MKGEQIVSDNLGIGKQVASSVVCTTHDCFILSSLPRSCLCDTYCTKFHPLGICESWREASRAAGVCAWTVHVMSHEWPCMLESICLLETYSREGDVWSKSLVIVDLKAQHSVETRIIGSESIAMKQATSYIWGLHDKLRMRMDGDQGWWASVCVWDNKCNLCNTTASASTMKSLSGSKRAKFVWMVLHHLYPEKEI